MWDDEDQEELDRLCDTMIEIRKEIQEQIDDPTEDNVLKNAPHTCEEVTGNEWTHTYSREKAAYPLPFIRGNKFWPSVGRIDQVYGDKNLMCTCGTAQDYMDEKVALGV